MSYKKHQQVDMRGLELLVGQVSADIHTTDNFMGSGPTVALLGDSLASNNSSESPHYIKQFTNRGWMTWLNILSGQAYNFTIANNFGKGGDTMAQVAARVGSVVAAQPDICIVAAGRNGIVSGETFSTATTALTTIITTLINANILPVILTIQPETGVTAAQKRARQRLNRWLLELGAGRADLRTSVGLRPRSGPLVVDVCPYVTDQSTGDWLSGYSSDNIHPNTIGAFWMGKAIHEALTPLLPPSNRGWSDINDYYHATDNPVGNLAFSGTTNYGAMTGTGGWKASSSPFTVSGDLADGWTVAKNGFPAATMACVLAKESPRTDSKAASGERQQLTFTCTGAGGPIDRYLMYRAGIENVSVGDVVFAELSYEFMSGVNVVAIELLLSETGPEWETAQQALDGSAVATLMPNVAHKGTLRTPLITLQTGMTSIAVWLRVLFDTTSGTASLDMYASDFVVRRAAA